jgi:predicted nucleic acid-binding Zn ribbon protein
MDDADISQARVEIEDELRRRFQPAYPSLKPKRHCFYCDEAVPSTRIFCNKECAEDYEKEQHLKRIAGTHRRRDA